MADKNDKSQILDMNHKEKFFIDNRYPNGCARKRGRPKIQYDRQLIIALRESGLSIRKISRETGISKSTVQTILSNVLDPKFFQDIRN
jgi:DNA-binding NarL/FixJ family response regulator